MGNEELKPEIIRCKDCTHYHTDVFGGELGVTGIWENLIVAHNACDRWTKGHELRRPGWLLFFGGKENR